MIDDCRFFMKERFKELFRWQTDELILIGTFAALIKIVTLIISLLGGGMNPVTMVLKNALCTSMLVVLFHKVPRTGVLTLYVVQQAIIMMVLMGKGMMFLPFSVLTAILADALGLFAGGYGKTRGILIGIAFYDFFSRVFAMGFGWFFMRENPALFYMALGVVSIGYMGCLIGLGTGVKFVKEFRHAGIIRH